MQDGFSRLGGWVEVERLLVYNRKLESAVFIY